MTSVTYYPLRGGGYDEREIIYNGRPLSELNAFQKTQFSSHFVFTEERTQLNILLLATSALQLRPKQIKKLGATIFSIIFADDSTTTIDVRRIESSESLLTQKIHDMGAGLQELVIRDSMLAKRLEGYNISFVVPFIVPDASSDEKLARIWQELQRFLRSEHLENFAQEFASISPTYPVLQAIGAKVLVKRGSAAFVQVMQGAMAVGSPTVGAQYLAGMVTNVLQAVNDANHAEWLLVWFQSINNPVDLRAVSPLLSKIRPVPFRHVFIGDGRSLAMLEDDAENATGIEQRADDRFFVLGITNRLHLEGLQDPVISFLDQTLLHGESLVRSGLRTPDVVRVPIEIYSLSYNRADEFPKYGATSKLQGLFFMRLYFLSESVQKRLERYGINQVPIIGEVSRAQLPTNKGTVAPPGSHIWELRGEIS